MIGIAPKTQQRPVAARESGPGRVRGLRRESGAALVLAIALLGLFTMLGMIYIQRMNIDLDRTKWQLRETRARNLTEAGVQIALSKLERAMAEGQLVQLLGKPQSCTLPAFKGTRMGGALQLMRMESRRSAIEFTILDESGKVNLNHAPAAVLEQLLRVDAKTAKAIRDSLPPTGIARLVNKNREGRWLLHPDDLVTRGLLTEEHFAKLDPATMTTYTVVDHENALAHININTAPVAAVAALLDLSTEEAGQLDAKRPFSSASALYAAAGKDAATFNVRQNRRNSRALPPALSLTSRCFRIRCTAEFGSTAGAAAAKGMHRGYHRAHAEAEAVVLFEPDGACRVLRWTTERLEGGEDA